MQELASDRVLKTLDGTSVTLDQNELRVLIDREAKMVGLRGIEEVIDRLKRGAAGRGVVWDDLSMLVSLLSEKFNEK